MAGRSTATLDPEVAEALDDWRRLYGGELEAWPVSGEGGVEVVGVRHRDFRAARGNWPKVVHHGSRTEKSLVLIHGLKDSPGFLWDVAARFAGRGVSVVLPLLSGHGRRDPAREMRRVDRESWRSSVDASVEIAARLGREVSIGGLSTGGALAVDKCLRDAGAIGGKVFLFSAALGLRPAARLLLATRLVPRWVDSWLARRSNTGIGGNPHKYSRRFFVGGRQVRRLIEEIALAAGESGDPWARFAHRGRVFVAHSEVDRTIPVAAIRSLVDPGDAGQHHILRAELEVAHAELVLAEGMTYRRRWPGEKAAPRANPEFEPMIEKALAFLDR